MRLTKSSKIGRNSLCSCGSNIKYKKCCLKKEQEQIANQFKMIRMLENGKEENKKDKKGEEESKEKDLNSIEGGTPEKIVAGETGEERANKE